MPESPCILLTNDDGIGAPGLSALYNEISGIGDVRIAAPATECSGVGHGITILEPLRIKEYHHNGSFYGYAVNGTPADCVKASYWTLLDRKPDAVISGINLGPNTGVNILYSGTVSAAAEGAIIGIPSMAISLATFVDPDFSYAAKFAKSFLKKLLKKRVPKHVLFNINIPACPENQIKGVSITRQGSAQYREKFDKRTDPFGRSYYWLTGSKIDTEKSIDVDDGAVQSGYISITPVQIDHTRYDFMKELQDWNIEK